MKRLLYSLVIYLLVSLPALAQNEGINFQGLARNAAGEVLVSQKISLRLSILLDSESGTVAYVETRQVTTNPQGIFAVVLGDANTLTKSTDFSTINWTPAPKFIKVEMDPNAGTNFTAMGTSKLQAVPFAFYAYGVDAENVEGILPLGSGGTGVASIADLKTSLGVDQVDNTADANKPLSAASQAALSTKANTADVTTSLASKVDKVTGKELSTNDYTTVEKAKLAAISGTNTGDQDLSAFATRTQLETKVDKEAGKGLSTNDYTTAEKAKLAAISGTNTGDQDLSAFATRTQLETKVDKEAGKGLSTNDYTTAEKVKLAAITGNATGPTGPVGPVGATGPAGATGPQGPIGLTGPVGPAGVAGATGPQGPIGLTGPAGSQGPIGLTGPVGSQGIQGPTGATGAAGKTVLNGTINPTNQGVDGDFYINTAANMLFGPKANGVWPTGVSLVGPQGAQGSTGAAGAQGIPGPTGATGAVGPAPTGTGIVTVSSGTLQTPGALTGDVTTSAAGLVTSIATGAVTSDKLLDGTIATADLANSAVTDEKIAGVAGSKVSGNITGNAANVTGTVAVGNGGTGATTLTANSVLVGNGTSAVQAVAPGTSGNVLTSNGTTWTSAAPTGGGVPYTGATGAVNLGAYDLTVNGVTVGKGLANIADNTAIGINALNAASSSGGGNSAFGYQALQVNTTGGSSNSAFGYKALTANTSGYNNTAIGASSLLSNTAGFNNIGIGASSLVFNTEGDYNIGVGAGALQQNKLGNTNIAIGREAGFHLNSYSSGSGTGSGNIFIGYQSGISRNRGSNNTAIGQQSLYSYTADFYDYSNAVAIGIQSGFTNQTNNNTFLGSFADVDYSINSSITNATAVGYQAKVSASNTIQLGNGSITQVITSGTITAPAFNPTSDLRLKSKVVPLSDGLSSLMQLNPVHYIKKTSLSATAYTLEENGFIAQEIQKILPFIVKEGEGVDKLLSVDYTSLIPILTKAIQEQQTQIEELQSYKSSISSLQKELEEIKKLLKGQEK